MRTDHPSAERLQALLEGELPDRELALVEEHVAGCARCASELDAWRVLLEDLDALPSHAPREGFAERVLADVRVPEPSSLAARAGLGGVVKGRVRHVSAELLQDWLDGMVAGRRGARVEAHLAACDDCAAEADEWAAVMGRLGRLGRLAPSDDFRARVMAGLEIAAPTPWAARVRARLAGLVSARPSHVESGRLQDYVEGALPARAAARVAAHLETCEACGADAAAWGGLMARLGTLERFQPEAAFADRVLAAVRLTPPACAPGAVAEPAERVHPVAGVLRPAWAGALAFAKRFVPRTRRAWATISGVAVTPAVTAALVLYTVFSHPTVTPSALASFVWWQVADLVTAGWSALSGVLLQSVEVFGLYSIFEALAAAPFAVASGVLLYSLFSALALRVLYKNVLSNRPVEGRHVRASAS